MKTSKGLLAIACVLMMSLFSNCTKDELDEDIPQTTEQSIDKDEAEIPDNG